MPQAQIISLADALVAELGNHAFNLTFEVERAYLPRYELKDLDEVRVTVVPKDDVGQRASRAQWQADYKIDLAIQQKLGDDELGQMDALILLGQELADHLRSHTLPDNSAVLVECNYAPLFDPEHLEKHRTLTTVLNLTFRGWRP